MRKSLLLLSATLLASLTCSTAFAGTGGGSPPPTDPGGDPTDPGDPGDPGNDPTGGGGGTPDPTGGTGGGTTPTTNAPATSPVGSGALVFTLDNLPSNTNSFYQPNQDYTALGLGTIASTQGPLTQTAGGLTVSFRTDDYIYGTNQQTSLRVFDGSFFPYLGVPTDVKLALSAAANAGGAPGVFYANFTDALSYFSVNAFRAANNSTGDLSFDVTAAAYSGLNGTGTLLGTTTVTVGGSGTGVNSYATQTLELSGLGGARSVTLLGSGFTNYDKITATVGNAVGDVPEPETWAMMVLGMGLVGAGARRSRGTKVVAA